MLIARLENRDRLQALASFMTGYPHLSNTSNVTAEPCKTFGFIVRRDQECKGAGMLMCHKWQFPADSWAHLRHCNNRSTQRAFITKIKVDSEEECVDYVRVASDVQSTEFTLLIDFLEVQSRTSFGWRLGPPI